MSNQDKSPLQPQAVPEEKPGAASPAEPTTHPVTPPQAVPPTEHVDTPDKPAPTAAALPLSPAQPAPASAERIETANKSTPMNQTLLVGAAARTCPKCGNVNRPGILVCEKCGTLLINEEKSVVATKRFETEKPDPEAVKNATISETAEMAGLAVGSAGGTQFSENMVLRLEIEGAPTPILLQPKAETSIGRRDPATGTMPDVDLSAYAGYRLGVSRKHAIIRVKNEQLELYDLGSSNGTSVNGARLVPHQPRVLRDGDEVILGKMVVRVLFQVRNRRK